MDSLSTHQQGFNTQYIHNPCNSGDNIPNDTPQIVAQDVQAQVAQEEEEEVPEVDIAINNVVCSFSVRCHLNLKRITAEAINVIYKRENNVINMKLRKPGVTANIWSSGKITCTGATSEIDAKIAARRVSRILQKQGYRIRFSNYRVVNVLGTCSFPFGVKLGKFASCHMKEACYEPELHPGCTFRIKEPKATLKVFSTGSVTITAPSVYNLQCAVQHIFPLVYPHRLPKPERKNRLQPAQNNEIFNEHNKPQTSFINQNNYKDRFTYKRRFEESDDDEESFGEDDSGSDGDESDD